MERPAPAGGAKGGQYGVPSRRRAFAAALLLVWINLAVGIVGAFPARFRPRGMTRAMGATALAQASVAAVVLILGLGAPYSPPAEILGANGIFVTLFAGSAWLFRRAARERTPRGAASG